MRNDSIELRRINPPQATDVETAVLGAILIDRRALTSVTGILTHECFYLPKHQMIYSAAVSLVSKGIPVDIRTLTERIHKDGNLDSVGGATYIAQLTDKVVSSANVEFHARIVQEKHMARQIIQTSAEAAKALYQDAEDVFDVAEKVITEVGLATRSVSNFQVKPLSAIHSDTIDEIAGRMASGYKGLTTGIHQLDKKTGGFQDSDLIVIAARPGMGKTAFTKSIIRGGAAQGKVGLMFSLEMSASQLVSRLMSEETGISSGKIYKGDLTEYQMQGLSSSLKNLYTDSGGSLLFIDDTPAISSMEIRLRSKILNAKEDLGYIIVDYLQLMGSKSSKGNRESEVSEFSRSLKALAKELNIPVFALSQLSRTVESRADKIPLLSDLRESGAIEQDADMVIFLFRPEYYADQGQRDKWINVPELGGEIHCEGYAEAIIAKNRHGSIGTAIMHFSGVTTSFSNYNHPNLK